VNHLAVIADINVKIVSARVEIIKKLDEQGKKFKDFI